MTWHFSPLFFFIPFVFVFVLMFDHGEEKKSAKFSIKTYEPRAVLVKAVAFGIARAQSESDSCRWARALARSQPDETECSRPCKTGKSSMIIKKSAELIISIGCDLFCCDSHFSFHLEWKRDSFYRFAKQFIRQQQQQQKCASKSIFSTIWTTFLHRKLFQLNRGHKHSSRSRQHGWDFLRFHLQVSISSLIWRNLCWNAE